VAQAGPKPEVRVYCSR